MATTKIKAIKSTLKKAIDYIINPEKTDESLLVSSYGCSVEFADLEMQTTEAKGSGKGNRVAYHFIQSFAPDDQVTPEQAHQIGQAFADKYLKGKYEYVIATHVDKGHIHNHIIFNATSFIDYKKYRYSGDAERDKIRAISDKLCRENGLSVIESQTGRRGWKRGDKKKNEKQKLMDNIDEVVKNVSTFEEFLLAMELEYHYDIKKRGKMISLKPEGKDSYIRLKGSTLGENYTEEMIRKRIENPESVPSPKINKTLKIQKTAPNKKKINLIVDISKNIKAQSSKGYEIVLQRSNTENLIKTMNFLIEHKLTTPDKFITYAEPIRDKYTNMRNESKTMEEHMRDLSEQIKYLQLYKKYKPIFTAYKKSYDKNEFLIKYGNEVALYRASLIYFEKKGIKDPWSINLSRLFDERRELKEKSFVFQEEFKKVKNQINELNTVQKNIEMSLNIKLSKTDENVDSASQKKDDIIK